MLKFKYDNKDYRVRWFYKKRGNHDTVTECVIEVLKSEWEVLRRGTARHYSKTDQLLKARGREASMLNAISDPSVVYAGHTVIRSYNVERAFRKVLYETYLCWCKPSWDKNHDPEQFRSLISAVNKVTKEIAND